MFTIHLVEIERSAPAQFVGGFFCWWHLFPVRLGFGHRQKWKPFAVTQSRENGVNRGINDSESGRVRMPEIEELVSVGEVQEPGANAIKADLRAARQEICADAGSGLFRCFSASSVLHGNSWRSSSVSLVRE